MKFVTAAALIAVLVTGSGLRLGAQTEERTSTLADQSRVNVTIYNADLALVHDRRRVAFTKGENRLAWRDVSAKIDPTTALIENLTAPDTLQAIEQNFDFNLLTYNAVIEKMVGQTVTVVHPYAKAPLPSRETAKLFSDNQGPLLEYADRIEQLQGGSYIMLTSLPPGMRDRPTLVLGLDSTREGPQDVELSYLTSGLGWQADYVGQVSARGDRMDLNGLVTLTNSSGTSYRDAHVQLVAGNVNVAPPTRDALYTIGRVNARTPSGTLQENFFEYHLYTLGRQTTIAENQTKQVAFMNARSVPIQESLELRGQPAYYQSSQPDLGDKIPVEAFVVFQNKGGELGVPLPGGLVRLYKSDSRGISQFLGSDRIDHTPKNETVRLHVGNSFDVTARKKQTNFRVVSTAVYDSSYEIIIGNAKTEAAEVLVVEPIPGDWQMLSESQQHQKSSSSTASWLVHVPADGKATLTYSVRVHY
jgi:hypothetical protein